jgi:hypothetical protein
VLEYTNPKRAITDARTFVIPQHHDLRFVFARAGCHAHAS